MRMATVLALVLFPGAVLLGGSADWEPSPGTVLIEERLGGSDEITFYFDPGVTEDEARRRVRRAAGDAGVPVREIERDDDHAEGLLRLDLATTIGRDEGFLRRAIPGPVLAGLRGNAEEVLVELPRNADLLAGPVRAVPDQPHGAFEITGTGDLRYRVPPASVAWSLVILLLLLAVPFPALRVFARWVERHPLSDEEKVHRLRAALMAAFLVPPLALLPLFVFTGLSHLPEFLLSEFAPSLTRSPTVMATIGIAFLWVVFLAAMVLAARGIQPVYRDIRGIEPDRREQWRKVGRAIPLLLLFPAWGALIFVLRATTGGGWAYWAAWGVTFVAFVGLVAPYVFLFALDTYRLPDETRHRLLDLCREQGVRVRDVRGIRARWQKMANAVFIGVLPRVRFVLVSDYLIDRFEDDEVNAVVAHEIGHGKGHHLLVKMGGILLAAAAASGTLFLVLLALDVASAVILAVGMPVLFMLAILTVQGLLGLRLERKADAYGAEVVGRDAMARALERLAEANTLKRRTGRVWDLLTQHPGIERRIEEIREEEPAKTG